jgi:hypothetical protein
MAAAVWYVGAGVLLFRGSAYLVGTAEAGALWGAVAAGAAGLATGMLRGRTLFLRANRRNLQRIDALPDPRAWQFFRPWFFAALVVMMAAGASLAWLAGLGTVPRLIVGGLELVIGTALLTSSIAFWRPVGEDPAPDRGEEPSYADPAEEPAA